MTNVDNTKTGNRLSRPHTMVVSVAAVLALSSTALRAQELVIDDKAILAARGASTQAATQPANSYTLSEAEYKHLDRQAQVALARVGASLDANPPTVDKIDPDRALALNLLDAILHDPAAPKRTVIGEFRAAQTKKAIAEMLSTKVTDDSAVVWQIYNMGFVVRTKSVTLGFDLVKLTHVPAFSLDNETMKAVVDQCDALFVSHEHLDHADREVARWALDAGKPVFGPNAMWLGEPIHERLTHLARDGNPDGHEVPVRNNKASIKVTIFPGYQHTKDGLDVEDNVYVVTTPEGISIGHTGDNNVPEGLPPAGVLRSQLDLLLMKLEPGQLKSRDIVAAFNPRLTLPSHFEEIGHVNVNAREPFWRGMERVPKLNVSTLIMMWGEQYRYTRTAN